jgi:hypothetical protein
MTFYGDCMKNVQRLRMTSHYMTFVPTFLFPRLKTKLKGRHFDTTEVINAESQAALNTLRKQDFQGAL